MITLTSDTAGTGGGEKGTSDCWNTTQGGCHPGGVMDTQMDRGDSAYRICTIGTPILHVAVPGRHRTLFCCIT